MIDSDVLLMLKTIKEQLGKLDALISGYINIIETAQPAPEPTVALHWPTNYKVITQAFGANPTDPSYVNLTPPGHEGVDIRAFSGTPIYAIASGVVTRIDTNHAAYGTSLRHDFTLSEDSRKYEATYGHMVRGSITLRVGDIVTIGQIIGQADSTGNVKEGRSHLHLNIKRDGKLINPMELLHLS
jgi:murein DD-endopeptidase MepM/ murein hydrolase activator NlpD